MRVLQFLPRDARQVLIYHNPHAGARDRRPLLDALQQALRAEQLHGVAFHAVDELLDAVAQAQQQGTLRAVVAAGGDGTVGLLINQLPDGVPLTLLPLGTENLLSKYLEQPANPQQLAARVAHGVVARLDAGCANGKLFALVAGCGFDADVVQRVHVGRRGHIRHWTYAKPILSAIRSYQYPALRIYCDATVDDVNGAAAVALDPTEPWMKSAWISRWAFIVNLPRYAGGLNFVPHALGTDGLLDVCTFHGGRFWNGIRYLCGVVAGRHLKWRDVRCVRVRRVRIECDEPALYQLDGDPGGPLPLDIQVMPERLAILVDQTWSHARGFAKPATAAAIESQRD